MQVTSLIAVEVALLCPYCNERQSGFYDNPQGGTFECDDCGKTYSVHKDADVEIL